MTNKPKLFLDMDNMLVDTLGVLNQLDMQDYPGVEKPDRIPGIFKDLPEIPGAVAAVKTLAAKYEIFILSTAPWHNPSAWTDKLTWLTNRFGGDANSPIYKHVIMTHEKGLINPVGGILIDDRPYHGAAEWDDPNRGRLWIQYGYDQRLTWASGELTKLLLAGADLYAKGDINERQAVDLANQAYDYQLYNPEKTFEKAGWE
ncbi:MAG: hypothetical protein LBT80_00660 [Lactobacillaceae bacterium]|jgi:hypothetical protein|nr:hypothetical protein [Lactobacillaceae bacterium]